MKDDYSAEIERCRKRIRRSSVITDETKKEIFEYDEAIKKHNREHGAKQQITGTRHERYLADLFRIAESTGCLRQTLIPDTGEDAVDEILEWVDEKYSNGYTIDEYHASLRSWGRFLAPDTEVGELPARIEKVKLGNVDDDQPAPNPAEVLQWQNVVQIIGGCLSIRIEAMVAFFWAAGGRPMSELWELQFKDVNEQGDHMLVSIPEHGKTGSRTIRVDVSTPYLRAWMRDEHPAHDEKSGPSDDTYIWTKENENELMAYQDIRRNFNRAAERAGVTKPHNPEHFRASRASVLAKNRNVTQRDLENHFGWKQASRVACHYVAKFGGQSRKHIAKADGAKVDFEEEDNPIVPVQCDNCGKWTPRHRDECLWCSAETVAELGDAPILEQSVKQDDGVDLLDMIVDGEIDADDLRALKKLKPVIKRRRDLWDRLDSYIKHAEKIDI